MSTGLCLFFILCLLAWVCVRTKVWTRIQRSIGPERVNKYREWEDVILLLLGTPVYFNQLYYFNVLRPVEVPLWATLFLSVCSVLCALGIMYSKATRLLVLLLSECFTRNGKFTRKARIAWRWEILKEQFQMSYPKTVITWALLKRLLICRLIGHRYAKWMDHKSCTCKTCQVSWVEDKEGGMKFYETVLFPARLIPLRHEYAVFNRELKKKES